MVATKSIKKVNCKDLSRDITTIENVFVDLSTNRSFSKNNPVSRNLWSVWYLLVVDSCFVGEQTISILFYLFLSLLILEMGLN